MTRILLLVVLALGCNTAAMAQLCQLQLVGPMCRPCGGSGQAHVRSGGLCTACTSNCPPIVPIAPDGHASSQASPLERTCTPIVDHDAARRAQFYKLNASADELSRLAAVSPSAALALNAFARFGEVIPAVDMRSGSLFAPSIPTGDEANAIIARSSDEDAELAASAKGLALKVEYATQVVADGRAILTITPWAIDAAGRSEHRADAAVAVDLALLDGRTAVVDAVGREAPVYRMTGYRIPD